MNVFKKKFYYQNSEAYRFISMKKLKISNMDVTF